MILTSDLIPALTHTCVLSEWTTLAPQKAKVKVYLVGKDNVLFLIEQLLIASDCERKR